MRFKKIPIVFTFDRRYLLPAAIAVKSLIDNSSRDTFYDIFILTDGLNPEEKAFLVADLDINKKYKINWINFDSSVFDRAPIAKNWPKSVYYRLLIPNLIKNYNKVIYSDVDVLFQDDLSDAYSINLKNFYWAGVIAEYNNKAICHQFFPEYKHKCIYMSGFMVMNLKKMRDDNLTSVFLKNITRFSDRLKMFDLEILNLSCAKIKSVPIKYCVLENIFDGNDFHKTSEYRWLSNYYSDEDLYAAKNKPSIIHYAGRDQKIWDRPESDVTEPYLKYIVLFRKKYLLLTNSFKNLQIGDCDLIGDKFNGHNLHLRLRDYGIDSKHLVWSKMSDDETTYCIAGNKFDRKMIRQNALDIQERYSLDSINNPLAYDILYNHLFLDSDVVHFHLINNQIFDIQLLPIITRLKPVIWTLHDPWALGGHCIHHFDCEKWKEQCFDCPYLNMPFTLEKDNSALNFEIKKMAIQNSDFDIVVASEWMKKKAEQSSILKGKRIHLIPFGIDQKIFKPLDKMSVRKELNIPSDAIVLTFRCDYSGFKGMDYIQYVVDNLKTNKKVYFLLLKEKLKSKNKKFNYKEFGWVKDDFLLSKIYNATDIFLAPSMADSFGLMVAEAMCCSVLPIVLEGTALPYTVNAYKGCGVSVNRDKQKYLEVVQNYIKNHSERALRAKKCLEYAKKEFDNDAYIKKIIEVYKEAICEQSMSTEDKNLLKQITKNMSVMPNLFDEDRKKINWIKGLFSYRQRNRLKKNIIIFFYKFDKIVPIMLRKKIKNKLIKFNFVKNYFIKNED